MARRPATPDLPPEDLVERIVDIDVATEMEGSFLEYAYSVIYSRASGSAGSSTRCRTWACARTART